MRTAPSIRVALRLCSVSPAHLTLTVFCLVGAHGCLNLNDHVPSDAGTSSAREGGAIGQGQGGAGGGGSNTTPGAGGSQAGRDAPAPMTPDPSSPACAVGGTRCSIKGDSVEVCTTSGTWELKDPCPSVCEMGTCVGACKPAERHCGRDQTPEICSDAGEWTSQTRCQFVCMGAGICAGECVPGAKRCGGSPSRQPEICDQNGKWIAQGDPCPNICSSGSCGGSCSPAAQRCGANRTPELCSAEGTWEPQTQCQYACTGDGTCSGECKPADRRCGGETKLQPELCGDDGRWKLNGESCPFVCSATGSCAGVCKPGAKRCSGDGNLTAQTCSGTGQWGSGRNCDFVCRDGDCAGVCKPGAKRCAPNGSAVQTCDGDASGWSDTQGCPAGCANSTCNTCQGGGTCGNNPCRPGTWECVGGQRTCVERNRNGGECGAKARCEGNGIRRAATCQNGSCEQGDFSPCPQPANSRASCSGDRCFFECNNGFTKQGNNCVPTCGQLGQECCGGSSCSQGRCDVNRKCVSACGGYGKTCCLSQPQCTTDGYVCNFAVDPPVCEPPQ